MTVGKAIYNLLLSNAALRAIVDTRIFPEVAQQDAELPYVVYNISSNEPSDTKREPSKMDTAQVEINLYSTSYTECIDMATHVRAALDRVTGTYSGVNVQSIQYLGEIIDFDEAQRAYNITSDYDVRVSRSDFEIAQGSPITGVTLGELSDVDTTGVTDGQVIAYDAAAQEWQPADDAGGVTELGQLDDVTLNNTAQGELLKYDGNDWVNDTIDKSDVSLGNVDNTSDADKPISTATQTALDDKADSSDVPTELDDLSDVKIIGAPSAGQSLVYNSGFFQLGQAGATTLGALNDVNTVGAAFGSLLAYNGTSWDISAAELPTDDVYFHQRYVTESEALRSGATATVELYFACTAQGNGLAEDAESDTPTAGKVIKRKIYYSEAAFADPDTGTWVEFTPAPADDASFATVKAALLEYLKARTGGTVPISLKQTWEEVSATAYLLDETFGSGAEAAYSTRQLRFAQTDCMVIRRASDSTTTTIGFDGSGNISEAAITTFCTGTTCTVESWLDQSGNGNDATAAAPANEPTIYTGGALVKENGKVALDFDGDYLEHTLSTSGGYSTNHSLFSLTSVNTVSQYSLNFAAGNNADAVNGISIITASPTNWGTYASAPQESGTNLANGTRRLLSMVRGTSGNGGFFTDGTSDGAYSGTSGSTTKSVGHPNTKDNIQEVIFYASDKSTSDRVDIESNVGDYFTQNTPLLDTYTGAAAAYSLRRLSSSYVGSAVEVYNGSSYADIGFNVFGELNTVALAAHCGSNNGFVSKWYDQAGSNDATQTNTGQMPKIYDGATGVVIVDANGKPALQAIVNGGLDVSLSYSSTDLSLFGVYDNNSSANMWYVVADNTHVSPDGVIFYSSAADFGAYRSAWGTEINESQTNNLGVNIWNGSNLTGYLNGGIGAVTTSAVGTTAFNFTSLRLCRLFSAGTAYFSEMILYTSDQSANRTGIETNINTFYNIF